MSLYTNQLREITIAPNCPWYQAQQTYGAPNVNWCESTSCSFINEPANTLSNLGFIIVAFILMLKYKESLIKAFGLIILIMGLLSGLYHATNNYLTQHFDFFGMVLMTSFLIAHNLKRINNFSKFSFFTLFWFISFMNMALLIVLGITNIPIQSLITFNAVPILCLELFNGYKERSFRSYRNFFISGFVIALAQVSAQIDLKRIYCRPENIWLHGHVIWHLLCAVGMYFIAMHIKKTNLYEQST